MGANDKFRPRDSISKARNDRRTEKAIARRKSDSVKTAVKIHTFYGPVAVRRLRIHKRDPVARE
jgi:hypothetical protein